MGTHRRASRSGRGILRLLARLAPASLRYRWTREWEEALAHRKGSAWSVILAAARDTLTIRSLLRRRGSTPSAGAHHPSSQERATMRDTVQDTRFAFRTVRKAPWFSLATIATLALGIGASLAVFDILRLALIQPLPFPEARQLVLGRTMIRGQLNPWASGADYLDYRDQSSTFDALGAFLPFPIEVTVTGNADPTRAVEEVVSANFFEALRVRPELGRTFRSEEGEAGAPEVVVISHELWRRRFEGRPDVVGRSLTLDGVPYTVVGVLPEGFYFMTDAQMWVPMRPDRWGVRDRDRYNWFMVGRLAPGVTLDRAQREVDLLSSRLAQAYPDTNTEKGLLLTPLHQALVEDYTRTLEVLAGAVLLVLLIACGNGAGILLARAPARRFELAVRSALGAPRRRLVRQLLAESVGLAMVGGLLGILLATGLERTLLRYLHMGKLGVQTAGLSAAGLGAALGLSLAAGLLAGAYPAWRGTRASADELRRGQRGLGDGGAGFRSTLLVAQVGLSVLLLTGAGLLVRTLANLRTLDPGFDGRNVLTSRVWVPMARYPEAEDRIRFYASLLESARALPGVTSATIASHIPIANYGNIYRATAVGEGKDPERVFLRSAFPGYFETLGIPLLAGRGIADDDEAEGPAVVVLSETAARRFFGEESPLGKEVDLQLLTPRRMEVVGVAGDVRLSRLEEDPEAALYVPFSQRAGNVMSVALKTRVPPGSLVGPLRDVLRQLDPEVPLTEVATVPELLRRSLADRRVLTLTLSLFALLPLVLAAVGLFAVLAYHVSRRRHEIGVRMAMGADARRIGSMVLRQGAVLVGVGMALGVGGALVFGRFLRTQLFGIQPDDPVTLAGVVIFVVAVAVLASAVPVWRAVRSDPRVALQAE